MTNQLEAPARERPVDVERDRVGLNVFLGLLASGATILAGFAAPALLSTGPGSAVADAVAAPTALGTLAVLAVLVAGIALAAGWRWGRVTGRRVRAAVTGALLGFLGFVCVVLWGVSTSLD